MSAGRPPTPLEEQRTEVVHLRVTQRQMAALLRWCLATGKTKAAAVYDLVSPTLNAWAKADEIAGLDAGSGGRDHEE